MNGNTVRVQLSIDSRPRREKSLWNGRRRGGEEGGEIKGANCGIIVWSSSSKNFDRNFGHFKLNLHASRRKREDESKNSRKSVTKRV